MFMAGLESHMLGKRHINSLFPFIKIAVINSVISFTLAFVFGKLFGLSTLASVFIGVTFVSSSVAAILPTLEGKGLLRCKLGRTIISSVIISDVMSLIALSIVLQVTTPVTKVPLILFYPLLFILLVSLKWAIPKIFALYKSELHGEKDTYHQDLRTVFLILIGTALSFELLGLHPVVAGFFAGVVLSGSLQSKMLYENIRAVGYGIFIPIFFLLVGVRADIQSVFDSPQIIMFAVSLTLLAVIAKLMGGYIGAKSSQFSNHEAWLIGSASVPQLSTTLAVAFTGLEAGIISAEIVTALIFVSIVTTTAGSFLIGKMSSGYIRDEVEVKTEEIPYDEKI
jgi:Kef-type K+ transport system membrane component KefB